MKGNFKVILFGSALILSGMVALSGCHTVQGTANGVGTAVQDVGTGVNQDIHSVVGPEHVKHHRIHHHKKVVKGSEHAANENTSGTNTEQTTNTQTTTGSY